MTRRSVLATVTALALGSISACGGGHPGETAKSGTHALVAYSREGGISFQSTTLVVSTKGVALVRSNGCATRFRLSASSWRRLRHVFKRTDLSALAGDYPAPRGAADVIAETIVVGRETVHIGNFSSLPAQAQRELGPPLGALGEVLTEGKRRLGAPCGDQGKSRSAE